MFQRLLLGLLCLVLAGIGTACAPKLVGPTTASGYFFTLEVSTPAIWLGVPNSLAAVYPTRAAVVVHVQDGQGRPVDGVAVAFEVEPIWAQSVVLSPPQTVTHNGVARTIFSQPQTTGRIRITARVDNTIARTAIVVESYEERLEKMSAMEGWLEHTQPWLDTRAKKFAMIWLHGGARWRSPNC